MRRKRVERIFGDHKSWQIWGGGGGYDLSYQSCDRGHAAIVEYAVIWRGRKVVGARFDGFKRWSLAN